MTEKIIVAIIGAGGVIIAALIALLKRDRKKEASTPNQSTGPIVQGSQGVIIATQGSTVIQHAAPARLDEINRNLDHIREVLQTNFPAVLASELDNVQEIDAMIHPNNWRPLPATKFVFPRPPGKPEDYLREIVGKLLVRYLSYAAFRAGNGKFRRFVVNLSFLESRDDDGVSIHFVTNDGAVLHELKRLLERRQTSQTLDEIRATLSDWEFAKKFAIAKSFSLEVAVEPDQKLASFGNAPLYEGEDTRSESILTKNVLHIDEIATRSIQGSVSKALAFLGRVQLLQVAHSNVVVHYDLDAQSTYKSHFLRLLYNVLDRKTVAYDLFRISIHDPEKWDYMYHQT